MRKNRRRFYVLNVKNRWCLITGASRGIGKEIARQMAELGANLVLQSRSREHSELVAAEVRGLGVQAVSVECDLGNPESVGAMLSEIEALGQDIDIVFNNAGRMSRYFADFTSNTPEDFREAFAVNFFAPVQISYHFLSKMIAKGFGRLQLTTSGMANEPELAAYACAKAALTKFVRDFACKLDGSDVMMNLMDPGWLRTDLGGPKAPNAVESVIPGAVVSVLLEDRKSGRLFSAQDFSGMDLKSAVEKARTISG